MRMLSGRALECGDARSQSRQRLAVKDQVVHAQERFCRRRSFVTRSTTGGDRLSEAASATASGGASRRLAIRVVDGVAPPFLRSTATDGVKRAPGDPAPRLRSRRPGVRSRDRRRRRGARRNSFPSRSSRGNPRPRAAGRRDERQLRHAVGERCVTLGPSDEPLARSSTRPSRARRSVQPLASAGGDPSARRQRAAEDRQPPLFDEDTCASSASCAAGSRHANRARPAGDRIAAPWRIGSITGPPPIVRGGE